jgi:hypothetical protein
MTTAFPPVTSLAMEWIVGIALVVIAFALVVFFALIAR